MQNADVIEKVCFVGWVISIFWKYFSKRSMSSLLVQLICLVLLLFLQIPKVFEALLIGSSVKGVLYYMLFILINIFVDGYHIEECSKKIR